MSDNIKEADDLEIEGSKSKKKLIIVMALFVLIFLGAGAYLGYAYIKNLPPFEPTGPTPEEVAALRVQQEEEFKKQMQEYFIHFEGGFTFNIESYAGAKHMMQLDVVVSVTGDENKADCEKHKALIASVISEVASKQKFDDLVTPIGRQRLKNLMLDAIRSKLSGIVKRPVVDQVLFTNFVLQ